MVCSFCKEYLIICVYIIYIYTYIYIYVCMYVSRYVYTYVRTYNRLTVVGDLI